MGGLGGLILALIAGALGIAILVMVVILSIAILGKVLRFIGHAVTHVFSFIFGVLGDVARTVGSLVLIPILAFLVVGSVLIGRWSAAGHYGRAVSAEFSAIGKAAYRVCIGRPFKLLGLSVMTEGLEKRLPQVLAETPGSDKPSKSKVGMFDGYEIIGSLPGGGSGGRLYIATPDALKRAAFERRGGDPIERVVIKVFSLKDGSSLPQILRESRALEAAKKLGLVLEHSEEDGRFFYVMRYVPGDSLSTVTTRLHAESGENGLDAPRTRLAIGYAADILSTLHTYHSGGLWHKDVKPDNIIVDGERAHLVDFGLVTPLRSAMTLTTHGTEYFRDPELVRQALRGVKVHQIDGGKFDVYAAGAVLYSVIENSFPAHGGLSQISKRCPEALRWIVRRAMAEYDKRYANAQEMLADLRVVIDAKDPFALKPVDLPSMGGAPTPEITPEPDPAVAPFAPVTPAAPTPEAAPARTPDPVAMAHAGTPVPPTPPGKGARPKLKVSHWLSGKYEVEDASNAPTVRAVAHPSPAAAHAPAPAAPMVTPPELRKPASEQRANARERARLTRERARDRVSHRRAGRRAPSAPAAPRRSIRREKQSAVAGIFAALLVFGVLFVGVVSIILAEAESRKHKPASRAEAPAGLFADTPDAQDRPDALEPALVSWNGEDPGTLIVSDLAYPVEDRVENHVAAQLERLRDRGFQVIGDFANTAHELSPEAEAKQIALVAQARHARGLTPFDDDTLTTRLLPMLSERDEIDMILYLAPFPNGKRGYQYLIVTEHEAHRGQVKHDEIADWSAR